MRLFLVNLQVLVMFVLSLSIFNINYLLSKNQTLGTKYLSDNFSDSINKENINTDLIKKLHVQHSFDSLYYSNRIMLFEIPYFFDDQIISFESVKFRYNKGFTLFFYVVVNENSNNMPVVKLNKYSPSLNNEILLNKENNIELHKIKGNIYCGKYYLYEQLDPYSYFQVVIEGEISLENKGIVGISVSFQKK